VSISVVKCSEVLQCNDGLNNIIRTLLEDNLDNVKLLIIYSFGSSIFYQCICGCIPV